MAGIFIFFFSQVYSHKKSHQLIAREDHLPWQPALRDCQFWHRKLWGANDETLASWTRMYCLHKTKASGPVCSGFHGAHPALVRKTANLMLVLSTASRLGNTISPDGRQSPTLVSQAIARNTPALENPVSQRWEGECFNKPFSLCCRSPSLYNA